MVRWRLLLEEFHPTFKHMAGADNDATDTLSCLNITTNNMDTIDWEPKQLRLTYKKDGLNKCLRRKFLEMEYEDDISDSNNDQIITLAGATKIINKEYMDFEFTLNVNMFQKHQ